MAYGEGSAGVLSQEPEGDFGLALADHQVHDNQALVDDGPGGVAEAVRQGAEDLAHARLARVGCDEDVLDILGLGCGELSSRRISTYPDRPAHWRREAHLDLGPALYRLLKGARHGSTIIPATMELRRRRRGGGPGFRWGASRTRFV